MQMVKKERRAKEVVTREYTINLHKKLHSTKFKSRAPKAVKEIRKFASKIMGTKDVRLDVGLNKAVWGKGVKNVPTRLRIVVSRRRNEDEDATVGFIGCVGGRRQHGAGAGANAAARRGDRTNAAASRRSRARAVRIRRRCSDLERQSRWRRRRAVEALLQLRNSRGGQRGRQITESHLARCGCRLKTARCGAACIDRRRRADRSRPSKRATPPMLAPTRSHPPPAPLTTNHHPIQEEMYSFVTVAADQTTKGKGPVVVQDS
jgi:large subunit ribosomal protein L31e